MTRVEQLWAKSAEEIKESLLEQCQVIFLDADFSEVGLDKIVVDSRIVIAPEEDNEGAENPEADLMNPAFDP